MFLSLNRKIVYSILSLFLISLLLFTITFYVAYSSKIEKDQIASIQRNQQYTELLYRSINLTKELKQLLAENPGIRFDENAYKTLNQLVHDQQQSEFFINEQKAIAERSRSFDEQYRTISIGISIISSGAVLLALFIIFIGYLISRWILRPINNMSLISEQIGRGNLSLRIPKRKNVKYPDELDKLGNTFNMMLDNLQATMSEIRDRELFLQSLIDSIPDGIRVIDDRFRIIIANKSYYKQTGGRPKAGITCYASSFGCKTPCDPRHTRCPLHEILHQGKKSVSIIQQFRHTPNRHLAINAAPLIYDGKHNYIVESIRDLSDDIDFSHQQKLSSLGFLSSSIAHEIKNQLGALRLIFEHFINKYYASIPDEREEKKMINMLYTELLNAIEVPERLLKLTRGYNAGENLVDCTAGISDVLGILDFEAKSKGIDLRFQPAEGDFYLNGNASDFKIAVINIILNAIKAIPGKGSVDIAITPAGKGFRISFADTGIGISRQDIPYIFNPFFSEGRQKNDSKGSGLGLAITKSIVEKFGGSIKVVSAVGKGSCFTLSFPRNKKLAKK